MTEFLHHNGAKLWLKMSGAKDHPPVVFVHGGPGYSSYSFENSIGPALEERLRMIYFDQRDCGRSAELEPGSPLGIAALVEDLEALRKKTGHERVALLAHSFGGLIALEYLRAYPKCVSKIIFVDVSADLIATLEHQINYAVSISPRAFPEQSDKISALAAGRLTPLAKLSALYQIVDWVQLQRELFWYRPEGLYRNAALDIESNLFDRHVSRLIPALEKSGYLESSHPELMGKLSVPAVLFSGRFSQCVGEKNIIKAAAAWEIPVVWFDQSGHLPHIEEPETFVKEVFDFLLRQA